MRIDAESNLVPPGQMFWCALALAAVLAPLSACYVAVREPVHEVDGGYTSEEVYVNEPAPPPRAEVIVGVAPSPNHVWIGGYWTRHSNSWYWVGGRWIARPHTGATWTAGHWDHRPNGYVWVRGHW
jgi:WXXGXW repeat (2 copies)